MSKALQFEELTSEIIPFLNTKLCSSTHLLEINMSYEINRDLVPGKVTLIFSYQDPINQNVRKTLNKFFRDTKRKFNTEWIFV